MRHLPRGSFPERRLRRNRSDPAVRRLSCEHRLTAANLIWPLFVGEGTNRKEEIKGFPGVFLRSIDQCVAAVAEAVDLGITAIALFPRTPSEQKNEQGTEALNPDNLVCRVLRAVRPKFPDVMLICDVALDPYTSHGHDGLLDGEGRIINDETVEALGQQSLLLAEAGCDTVAPSDMMDGRIGAIRRALDAAAHQDVRILSYAAKYASCFYGPFRSAVGSTSFLRGDKKTYQMNSANSEEALSEVALDLAEGADLVIVKPGMPYLDVVTRVKEAFGAPTLVYQVSGEYLMIRAAATAGELDEEAAILESLLCFRRAGADGIFTYFAPTAAHLLRDCGGAWPQ